MSHFPFYFLPPFFSHYPPLHTQIEASAIFALNPELQAVIPEPAPAPAPIKQQIAKQHVSKLPSAKGRPSSARVPLNHVQDNAPKPNSARGECIGEVREGGKWLLRSRRGEVVVNQYVSKLPSAKGRPSSAIVPLNHVQDNAPKPNSARGECRGSGRGSGLRIQFGLRAVIFHISLNSPHE